MTTSLFLRLSIRFRTNFSRVAVSVEVLSATYERLERLGSQVKSLEVVIALWTETYEGRIHIGEGAGPSLTLVEGTEE